MRDKDLIYRGDVLAKAHHHPVDGGLIISAYDVGRIPPADVKLVAKGEWERHWDETFGWVFKCSSCGQQSFSTYKFCPCWRNNPSCRSLVRRRSA